MIRKIIVGNDAQNFKCSAATSILYKRLFGQSLTGEMAKIVQLSNQAKDLQAKLATIKDENREELVELLANDTSLVDLSNMTNELIPQMAYIMWLEANKPQRELFQSLTEEAYILWLTSFEKGDMSNVYTELMNLWTDTNKTNSNLKNV